MSAIDVGAGATDRSSGTDVSKTLIDLNNPANDTGTLDTVEFYFVQFSAGLNIKVGTFYGSGTSWTSRDYETIGSVSAGSKQTFTGLDIDVETSDCLGIFGSGGQIESDGTGGEGILYKLADQFGKGTQTYTLTSGDIASMYGTGSTPPTALPVFDYHFNNMRS